MSARRSGRRMRLPMLAALVVLTALGGLTIMTAAAASNDGAEHASATLRDVDGNEIGFANFTETATGVVKVSVHVNGLSEGLHGIHVHNTASCAGAGFSGAGSHHNPSVPPALHGSHGGDLPNLTVNRAGIGRLNATTERFTLSPGVTTVFDTNGVTDGSALVIHALEDDLSPATPTGNSGARIACGIIEAG